MLGPRSLPVVLSLTLLSCAADRERRADAREETPRDETPVPAIRVGGAIPRFADAAEAMDPPYASVASMFGSLGAGAATFDYDGDGRLDLFVTNDPRPTVLPELLPPDRPPGQRLYRNTAGPDGVPRFVDVTDEVGLRDEIGIGYAPTAVDFDNDGDKDLFVANGLRGVPLSMFGIHGMMEIPGWRDPGGPGFPPVVAWDTETGQLNGEFVVLSDPLTGRQRGEGRNSLYQNLLAETGEARFVDVTDEGGDAGGTSDLPGGRHSTTASAADVDLDGDLDLFVANFLDPDFWGFFRQVDAEGNVTRDGSNLLFNGERWQLLLNDGDLRFTDRTVEHGLVPAEPPSIYDMTGNKRSVYDSNLVDAAGNPVGEDWPHCWASGWSDLDRDRDPDLVVACDIPGQIHVFRNRIVEDGVLSFEDVSEAAGTATIGDWMSVTFADFDEDLDMDPFVGNFGGSNYTVAPSADPLDQLISGVAEYNRWVTDGAQTNAWFRNEGRLGADGFVYMVDHAMTLDVRHSRWIPPIAADPDSVAEPLPVLYGMEPYEFVWGSAALDFDNSGTIDLYHLGSLGRGGDGGMGELLSDPGRLLRNDRGGRWRDVTVEAHALDIVGVDYGQVDEGLEPLPEDRIDLQAHEHGKAVVTGDFDGNGFVDLFLTNSGGFDANLPDVPEIMPGMKEFTAGPAFLYLNGGNANHWLQVELVGQQSNRDGVGAVIIATVEIDGQRRRLAREVAAGTGYQSMHDLVQHIGLGDATRVTKLTVRWPSGVVDTLTDLPADGRVRIEEGSAAGP